MVSGMVKVGLLFRHEMLSLSLRDLEYWAFCLDGLSVRFCTVLRAFGDLHVVAFWRSFVQISTSRRYYISSLLFTLPLAFWAKLYIFINLFFESSYHPRLECTTASRILNSKFGSYLYIWARSNPTSPSKLRQCYAVRSVEFKKAIIVKSNCIENEETPVSGITSSSIKRIYCGYMASQICWRTCLASSSGRSWRH